ncbi:MMPL family transporter [Conexibacter sp. CPCC 206217]|uniref:MMPL family transporter n=1 Tax=Conexibacter sp. CPCC 206217 TaxID=3064574 RepID=UPI0027278483|nr:MMPL family transporter [Conexibacter sp. CPCC 206217]MDO8212897.1 MMPL family transporter [Conexibacter sp. CPCC 206217]
MTGALYRLGRFCVRYRLAVVVVWVAIAIGLVIGAGALGSKASDDVSLPGTGSQQVTDLLQRGFPSQANGSSPIVLKARGSARVTDSRYADSIDKTVSDLQKDEFVAKVVSPLDRAGAGQVSRDGTVAYISVFPDRSLGDVTIDDAQAILDKADPAKAAGLEVSAGGPLGSKLSKPETEQSEVVGLAIALIVLAFTFGSFVAMGLPIVSALVGVFAGVSGITLLTHLTTVPTSASTLAIMLGLGVGIDYALFILTTHRETLSRGMGVHESVARAVATSGGAVLFAGSTVVVAVCSLAVAGIPLVTALGLTTGLMVAIAIVCALTLLPAILALVGTRVNALPLPGRRPNAAVDVGNSRWARFAGWIMHHPIVSIAVALAILIPLAIPALSLHLGQTDTAALPEEETARQAYDAITDGFGVGANGPIVIAARLSRPAQPGDADLTRLQQAVGSKSGVAAVTPVTLDGPGQIATFNAIPRTAPSDRATEDLVDDLRDTTIPDATRSTDVSAYVGGSTASFIDLGEEIADTLPETILVIIALSFVLLAIAFRSLLIPLKAAVMNLLSIGAAYGVVVMVFQYGWFTGLVGLQGEVPIVSYLPLLMFAGLFGLSMDYEVFLMSHVQEHYKEGLSPRAAIVKGLAESARVITAAAAIMVAVFASFILNGDPTIKQFGVGLSVAVIIDATVVRCLLVPAVMALMGRAAWWIPAWLDRILPRISVEGHGYFRDDEPGGGDAGAPPPTPPSAPSVTPGPRAPVPSEPA